MERYCVYKHTCPNGKVYIGLTRQEPNLGWKCGSGYKANKHFSNAIQKWGWDNFKHDILFQNLSRVEACEKEKELIKKYKSYDRRFGYNKSCGGESNAGLKFSSEARENMRKARREGQRDILQIDLKTGEIIAKYISINEASRSTSINAVGIGYVAKGKRKSAGGFGWAFGDVYHKPKPIDKPKDNALKNTMKVGSEELKQHLSKMHDKDKKPVKQIDKITGEVIMIYPSVTEASRKTGANDSSIIRVCKGKQHTCIGFKWEYVINN